MRLRNKEQEGDTVSALQKSSQREERAEAEAERERDLLTKATGYNAIMQEEHLLSMYTIAEMAAIAFSSNKREGGGGDGGRHSRHSR
eukprot:scaffold925_cov178-Ochromonas_danica.AAC.3